jgi:hypothetical protein
MHLLTGTPLQRQILKEFEDNWLPYAEADFLWAYVAINMKVI